MSRKQAAAFAIAGAVFAVLLFVAVAGEGDDSGKAEQPTDEREAGVSVGGGTTERDAARGTGRGARTSEPQGRGETATGGARAATEGLKEPAWNVYVVQARGGPLRRLTNSESEVPENPDWSPAGVGIVFAGGSCEDCDAGLRVVSPDGSGSRSLRTPVANVADPSSSPSGRTFAVTRVGGVIYSIDSVRGAAQRLTSGSEASEGPAWSPNTHRIAYARQVGPANWDIYSMNADGRGKHPLIGGPRQELAPAWSPNGRKIAFQRQERSGVWAIYTANGDGSDQTKITYGRSSAEQPAWSPDGRKIALVRVTVAGSRIGVLRLTGGRRRQALVTPLSLQAAYPDWSPDGRTIVFTAKHQEHE
jgi:TolB protein